MIRSGASVTEFRGGRTASSWKNQERLYLKRLKGFRTEQMEKRGKGHGGEDLLGRKNILGESLGPGEGGVISGSGGE